jgi:hypothetical protein
MWWARALGLGHDAQPANGLSYKVLFEAGARIARKQGEEPFPFMAKVWAAMKELHKGEGDQAPNALARDIGLGQKDIFDGSTTPGGLKGKQMLRSINQGGFDLYGPLGVSKRAAKAVDEEATAKHLLNVATESGHKGLRVFRPTKMENALDKKAYEMFVTNRPKDMPMKDAEKLAAQWVTKQIARLKDKSKGSVAGLRQHLMETLGDSPLGLKADEASLARRVDEILDPKRTDQKRYTDSKKAPKAQRDLF